MYLAVFSFKIAIIVSIRYVFWAAGMPKMLSRPGFLPGPYWQSLQRSPRLLSCCLLLSLNIAGLRWGLGIMLLGAWKVLEKSWNSVTKRVGTLIFDVCAEKGHHIDW